MPATTTTSRITPARFATYCRSAAICSPAEHGHLHFKNASQLEQAKLAPEVIFDYRHAQFIGDAECEVQERGWVTISLRGARHYHVVRRIYWPDGTIEIRSGTR